MKMPWDKDAARRNGPAGADALRAADEQELGDLEPGDALSFWGEGNRVVTCVFDCVEGLGEREYRWRWIFLDDGSLVEYSADGRWRYTEHEIVPQGSGRFSELVGPRGLLEQFEARVRDDTVGENPVIAELRGRRYRVTSTGTVAATLRGQPPRLGPWAQFVGNAERNVYFGRVAADEETEGVLGVWTSHVCLSFGRPIAETDVDGIYRRSR